MTTYYWSRAPGRFVNKRTGNSHDLIHGFKGTVREWYETLVETITDLNNEINPFTNVVKEEIVTGPTVYSILANCCGFDEIDEDHGSIRGHLVTKSVKGTNIISMGSSKIIVLDCMIDDLKDRMPESEVTKIFAKIRSRINLT